MTRTHPPYALELRVGTLDERAAGHRSWSLLQTSKTLPAGRRDVAGAGRRFPRRGGEAVPGIVGGAGARLPRCRSEPGQSTG